MTNAKKTYQDLALLLEKAEASILPPPAVGAKFKWVSETNPETYRIAIVTHNGLLQVKSVTQGTVECDTTRMVGGKHPLIKKMFANEAEWRASLPQGKTDLSLPSNIAEAQRHDELFKRLSDVEKIDALRKRYKIWHCVMKNQSYQELLDGSIARLNLFRTSINNLTNDELIEKNSMVNLHLVRLLNSYSRYRMLVAAAGADANTPRIHYGVSGTASIVAKINGQPHFINTFEGKIAAVVTSNSWGKITFYKDFAEMGNPSISVLYRKRVIHI